MESKLLDMRDCLDKQYQGIYQDLLQLQLLRQPKWFRPLLLKSVLLKRWIGYDHWSRRWEYPWAISVAAFEGPCRVLDVGGGGSSFADYLDRLGHDCYVIDPSLRQGIRLGLDKNKSFFRNLRSFIYRSIIKSLRIHAVEGLYCNKKITSVKYFSQSAQKIDFPTGYFKNVFCLSVMEHIPVETWKDCMREFKRVLRSGGRLVITLDMSTHDANNRLYLKLVESCKLKLIGDPYYSASISQADKHVRHPGHSYETIGLVWQA
jgi:SAM-dependent methyltransferase